MHAPDQQIVLEQPFLNLRQRWPQAWPGLPLVLSRCLEQLGHRADDPLNDPLNPGVGLPPVVQRLKACMADVAWLVESDGQQRAQQGLEPAYHNRLHVADTVVALTLLLLALRNKQPAGSAPSICQPSHGEWLVMLAMLAHDLMHDGRINRRPGEMETLSWRALLPLLKRHGVAAPDQAALRHLILMTDPTQVAACHAKMALREFSIHQLDALVVLMEEADILVSSLPELGRQLTVQLSREWASCAPERAQALLQPQGRLGFLRHAALFSSPAAVQLGLPQIRQAQIDALEAA